MLFIGRWVFNLIIDLLFPRFCIGCKKMDTLMCNKCYQTIHFYPFSFDIQIENNNLDSLTAMAHYEGAVQSGIQQLKYNSVKDIGTLFGTMIHHTTTFPIPDIITSTPLHKNRQRERGFNQAEVIAQSLSKSLHVPYHQLLIRTKKTMAQAKTHSKDERLTQLKNIFALHSQAPNIKGKTILILDDVITTGATLNECAIVLKHSGCRAIHGLAVAHGT
jgi:competence protein ComFC